MSGTARACSCPTVGTLGEANVVVHLQDCPWLNALSPSEALGAGYVGGLQMRLVKALERIRDLEREVKRLRDNQEEEPEL